MLFAFVQRPSLFLYFLYFIVLERKGDIVDKKRTKRTRIKKHKEIEETELGRKAHKEASPTRSFFRKAQEVVDLLPFPGRQVNRNLDAEQQIRLKS